MRTLAKGVALLACLLAPAAADTELECAGPECQDETSQLQITRDKFVQSASLAPAPCPYNFNPPKCEDAEPQSPRDLIPDAKGKDKPKAATLTAKQAARLPLTNVHFHLGAEHRSLEYKDGKFSEEYDADPSPMGYRPGWECGKQCDLTKQQKKPYDFKYCKHVEVGRSYEVHYVRSSAGYSVKDLIGVDVDPINDGLGGAANGRGQLNPMITVQALVFQVVNGGPDLEAFKGFEALADFGQSVMYPGSTTGTSVNNTICSPYAVTWHVDTTCHQISPRAWDNFCKFNKKVYGLEKDLEPHGSRVLVDKKFVVPSEYVLPYDG